MGQWKPLSTQSQYARVCPLQDFVYVRIHGPLQLLLTAKAPNFGWYNCVPKTELQLQLLDVVWR